MNFRRSQLSFRAKRNVKQSRRFLCGTRNVDEPTADSSSVPPDLQLSPNPSSSVFRLKRNDAEIGPHLPMLSEKTTSYSSTSSSDDSEQYSSIGLADTNCDAVPPDTGRTDLIPTTAEGASTTKRSQQHARAPVVAGADGVSSASSSVYSHPFDEGLGLTGKQHSRQIPRAHGTTRAPYSACDNRGSHEDEQDCTNVRASTSAYDDPTLVLDDSDDNGSKDSESRILETPRALGSSTRSGIRHSSRQSTSVISQGELSPAFPYYNSTVTVDKQLSWGIELMDRAKNILSSQRRMEALHLFSQATRYFGAVVAAVQQAGPLNRSSALDVVALLYAARCLSHTSSIVTKPHESIQLLYKVTRLLDRARERVELLREIETVATVPKTTTANNKDTTEVCLDTMTLETLQFQANVLLHKLNDHRQALSCYEEIIRQLLYLEETQSWENEDDEWGRSVLLHNIHFVPMSQKKHTELLCESLSLFIECFEKYFLEDALYSFDAFEDALKVLRERLEENFCCDDELVDMVASSYKRLSEIYLFRHDDDRAAWALQDFAVVKLLRSGEPCSDAVDVLNALGEMQEEQGNFSEALECYELTLLALCRYYLKSGKKVAKALVNVARAKEMRDGESTESLEYWRASIALLSLNDTQKDSTDGTPVFRLQDYKFIMDKYCS